MKKIITLALLGFVLSGCSLFRTHKMDVEQGNVVSQENVSRLHTGMSEGEVTEIMGSPMLVNLFTPGQVNYIYTYQAGYGKMKATRVTCIFQNGRLRDIQRS